MIGKGLTVLNRVFWVLGTSLALGLAGCGGGSDSAPASTITPPSVESQSITGGGVKGPLANAVVTVYGFDGAQAGFKGAVVDTASTNASAAITGLALPFPIAPPYIMEFTSTGTTVDITTGQFPVITAMRTVITQSLLDAGEQVYATPLTTMAVDIAVRNAADTNGTVGIQADEFEAALSVAASQVVSTLGFGLDNSVDIFDTPPLVDNTTDTAAKQANVAAYRAAVEAVTAVAYQIDQQTSGGDTDSVLAELAADLADNGVIDGSAGGAEINPNTLQVFQQDPQTLPIPNSPTNQTVADVQAILIAEKTITGSTTTTTELDAGGSITTVPAPAQTNPDLDGDGHLNVDDAFPTDASEYLDTDGDGTGNNADIDDDNDGWADDSDDYPLDATRYIDPALDRDGDTILNGVDNCPLIANEDQADVDADGIGDACDPVNDQDFDGIDDATDNCPTVANASQANMDGDAYGDACDVDIDGDGVLNVDDAFPYDATESIDTDGDGIGNNADIDDDNDGVPDDLDTGVAPAGSPSAGTLCSLLRDCDGDGIFDGADFNPVDATVTFNFAPIVTNDTATALEDAATFAIAVTTNDTDNDGNPNDFVSLVSIGANNTAIGTAAINGNNVDYTPAANASGVDTFTYTVTDGTLTSQGSVTVTITAVNDAPVAIDDTASTSEDTAVTTSNVTLNDTDVEGDSLSAVLLANAGNGNVVDNADSTFTYTPNANFNGADSFTYTLSDGNGGSAIGTVNITVNAVNDNPVANADSLITAEDTAGTTVDVTANDTDVDAGTTLTVVAGNPTAANGSVVNNNDGTFTYTPNSNFNGSDSFSYTLNDGNGGSVTGTVNVTVTAVNDNPIAVNDSVTTDEDSSVSTGNVTLNDTDVEGDSLSAVLLANAGNGNVVDNADNTFTYTPNANFNGADSFTYTLSDGNGGSAIGTVNITVNAVNDNPVANADSLITAEDTAGTTVDVTANDTDVDAGTTLTVVAGNPTAANGSVVNNNNGTFTYTPNSNFNGSDSFSYTLNDGNGGSATGTVNVTVTAVNDLPSGTADAFNAGVSTLAVLNVLANDTDIDGDTLIITGVSAGSRGSTITTNGSTVSFTDTVGAGTETFTYDISDGNGGTATGISVTVTVTANIPPVANADTATTNEDTAVTTGNVLSNDTDGGDGPGALSITTADAVSANGGVVINHGDGTFTYTPAADYFGADTFTYTVSDTASSSVGTVTITVNAVNDAPVGVADEDTTPEDTAFTTINVLTNDTDTENDALSVSASDISSANGGVVIDNGDGTFNYSPAANFNGVDTFNYTVSDGFLTSSAQVSITVTAVNDAPVAADDNEITTINTPVITANVLANDTDVEGDTLFVAAGNPTATSGTVVNNNNGTFTYTPNTDYEGSDSFDYTVSDGEFTDVGTVNITVSAAGTPISMTTLMSGAEGGVGGIEDNQEPNTYEYWTDNWDSGTTLFSFEDKRYNHATGVFDSITSGNDLILVGSAWEVEGNIYGTAAGDAMNISIRSVNNDAVEVASIQLTARYVDLGGELISNYLDSAWQAAMIDPAAVFNTGAKLITEYRFEALSESYWLWVGDWCEFSQPARFVTLLGNCDAVDVDTSINATGYAQLIEEAIAATAWVDPNDFSTPPGAVSVAWNGSTTLMVQLVTGGAANYYVVDWSSPDAASRVGDAVAGADWVRDNSPGVDMLQFQIPAAFVAQFPGELAEGLNYFIVEQNSFVRRGKKEIVGDAGFDSGVLNGIAMTDILDNFSVPPLTDLTNAVGTWVSQTVSGNGDPFLLHFFANGYYETSGTCDLDGTTGMEYGTFTTNGVITSSLSTQGACSLAAGISNGNSITINGDLLTLSVSGIGDVSYDRLRTTVTPLVGSWILGNIQDPGEGHAIITFLNNGTVVLSQDCTADTEQGFEYGNYTWDQGNTNALTGTMSIDTNATCGLVSTAPPAAFSGLTVSVSGDTLTLSIPLDGDVIFARHSTNDASLVCGYSSGWDDTADGGAGAPINPNSFADYEAVVADCGTAQTFTVIDVAGGVFDDGAIISFYDSANAGTLADPKTGQANDAGTLIDFEWYLELATGGYTYLVIYSDNSLAPGVFAAGEWFRDTKALMASDGTNFTFTTYTEQNNFSDTDRAVGSDGEIWTSIMTAIP